MTNSRLPLDRTPKPHIFYDCIGLWMCIGIGTRGKWCYARDFSPRMAYLMWQEFSS